MFKLKFKDKIWHFTNFICASKLPHYIYMYYICKSPPMGDEFIKIVCKQLVINRFKLTILTWFTSLNIPWVNSMSLLHFIYYLAHIMTINMDQTLIKVLVYWDIIQQINYVEISYIIWNLTCQWIKFSYWGMMLTKIVFFMIVVLVMLGFFVVDIMGIEFTINVRKINY